MRSTDATTTNYLMLEKHSTCTDSGNVRTFANSAMTIRYTSQKPAPKGEIRFSGKKVYPETLDRLLTLVNV
jgi:hypothetical protein